MSFLRRRLYPHFEGEIVSDVCDLAFKRIPGASIKHRVKQNWLKMYDKAGSVLRLEVVIYEPDGLKVRKQVTRKGRRSCSGSICVEVKLIIQPTRSVLWIASPHANNWL